MSDSDDYDLGEAPPSRYSNLGKRSIDAIFENANSDRLESKKQSKHLQLTMKSPNIEYQIELWHARLTAFRKHTLKIQNAESEAPIGTHIERFFAIIVGRLVPTGSLPLSIRSLKTGLSCVIKASTFYYPDFRLTNHDSSRIDSMFQTLLLQKKVTEEIKTDQKWVGAFVVSKLIRRMYERALDSGVSNWDVTLAKIQSILLVAALACRVGDINEGMRDRHENPFLMYEDLTVKLVGGDDIQNMVMMVRMRNNKGQKGVVNQSSNKRLTSQNGAMLLHLCPIKIVLILALRLGHVKGATTIDDVLAQTAVRPDRTVQWTDPFQPVLPAFTGGGGHLIIGKAANSRQLQLTLNDAALMIGMVGKVTPHDLRRGAAQDLYNAARQNITSAGSTAALGEVQSMLTHSNTSLHRGVTKEYVGAADPDFWTPRIEAGLNDDFTTPFMVDEADAYRPPSYSSNDVNALCERFNIDPTLKKDRLQATVLGKKVALNSWSQAQRNATVSGRDQTERVEIADGENIERAPLHEEGEADDQDEREFDDQDEGEADDQDESEFDDQDESEFDDQDESEFDDQDESETDDQDESEVDDQDESEVDDQDEGTRLSLNGSEKTLDPGARLANLLASDTGAKESQDEEDALLASLVDDVLAQDLNRDSTLELGSSSVKEAQLHPSALLADITPIEFVRKFSVINTTTSGSINCYGPERRNKLLADMNGNSREPASLVQLFCKNRNVWGCIHKTGNPTHMQLHEQRCKPPKISDSHSVPKPSSTTPDSHSAPEPSPTISDSHPASEPPPPISCPKAGCNKTFANRKSLNKHAHQHDWVPQPCPHGCKPGKLYKARDTLQYHIRNEHSGDFKATRCLVLHCPSVRTFKSLLVFTEHMYGEAHSKLPRSQIDHLVQTAIASGDSDV